MLCDRMSVKDIVEQHSNQLVVEQQSGRKGQGWVVTGQGKGKVVQKTGNGNGVVGRAVTIAALSDEYVLSGDLTSMGGGTGREGSPG